VVQPAELITELPAAFPAAFLADGEGGGGAGLSAVAPEMNRNDPVTVAPIRTSIPASV